MTDFSVSPEEKMNNYYEFNQAFPVYQSTQLEPGFSLKNPKEIPSINVFGSGPKPTVAKGTSAVKPTKDKKNAQVEETPLDKLKNIYRSSEEYSKMYPSVGGGSYENGPVDIQQLKQQIAKVESEGMGGYEAQNKDSSAVGKYQFLWGRKAGQGWGDSIKSITGVKSKEEFKKTPSAQEKYFDYYAEKTLRPQAAQLRKEFPESGLSDSDLMKGIHFQGLGKEDKSNGMRKVLSQNLHTAKLQKNNLSFYDYLKASKK